MSSAFDDLSPTVQQKLASIGVTSLRGLRAVVRDDIAGANLTAADRLELRAAFLALRPGKPPPTDGTP